MTQIPTHHATAATNIQALLSHTGSLTDALRQRFQTVDIGWHQESIVPGNPAYWQRDVLIHGDDTPLVFARTRIDAKEYDRIPGLTALGSKPLGDWLFQQPTCESIHFELRPTQHLSLDLPPLPAPPIPMARDRLYRVEGVLIWIVELFLDHSHAT